MEKDTVIFHVVGTRYQGPAADLLARTAEEGLPLDLVPEPDNPVDAEAVAVHLNGVRLGYVPNRGISCDLCHRSMRYDDGPICHCGGRAVDRGLAGRLVHSQALSKGRWAAYVSGVDLESKDGIIRCTLVLED